MKKSLKLFFGFIMCLTTLFQIGLQAQQNVLVIPSDAGVSSKSFQYTPGLSEDVMNCWQIIDKSLQQNGMGIEITYLKEISNPEEFNRLLVNAKKIICCNIPNCIPNWKEKIAAIPKDKLILITYEPPSVLPDMFKKETLNLFGTILTWDDLLIDHEKFFKFNYPVLNPMIRQVTPFSSKKLLTQISGNKISNHPHELYSERLNIIQYFEKQKGDDFDFYGVGWGNLGYKNYKGTIEDKIGTLKNYKFSICFENINKIEGYITEKIFDCFQAGVVPVYSGASNITEYIPANCFIARENFESTKHLVKYLKSMKEKEYNQYLKNIRAFLDSEPAQDFTNRAFAKSVLYCIDPDLHIE